MRPLKVWRQPFHADLWRHRLVAHLRRWALLYLVVGLAITWFHQHYSLGLNVTESLPGHVFLIHHGESPGLGEYVAFRWPGGGPYPAGATFVKLMAGLPGDVVTQVDGSYFINDFPVGRAKDVDRQGHPLLPGPTGTIPPGTFYVLGTHPDSLDSRYALTGWVPQAQIIGRAYVLF